MKFALNILNFSFHEQTLSHNSPNFAALWHCLKDGLCLGWH